MIRFGLRDQSVGEGAVEDLRRRAIRQIRSLADLCERVDTDAESQDFEALSSPARLFWRNPRDARSQIDRTLSVPPVSPTIARAVRRRSSAPEDKANGKPAAIQRLEEWPQHELLAAEKELLVLRHRPSARHVPIIESYARQDVGVMRMPTAAYRLGGLIAAQLRRPKDQQTLRDGDLEDPRLRAGPLHERTTTARVAHAYPRDRRWRSEHRRRQAEDFPANHAAGGRAAKIPGKSICACIPRI